MTTPLWEQAYKKRMEVGNASYWYIGVETLHRLLMERLPSGEWLANPHTAPTILGLPWVVNRDDPSGFELRSDPPPDPPPR